MPLLLILGVGVNNLLGTVGSLGTDDMTRCAASPGDPRKFSPRKFADNRQHIYIIIPKSACVCVFVHVLFENG